MPAFNFIQQNRAAIFDWSVVIASFSLGFIFPTIADFVKSSGFYYWVFTALLLYTTGAMIKHLPLSYRLTHASYTPRPVPYIIFLLVGHWIIFLFIIILTETVFRQIFGLKPVSNQDPTSGTFIFLSCVGSGIITWFVYRSKTKRKSKREYPASFLFIIEMIADILLIAGVSILSFIFWDKGAMELLAHAKTESFGDIWFLFVFLTILFLFFYLPLRYLYFVEDSAGGANRRRLLIIFVFMLLRAIFRIGGF